MTDKHESERPQRPPAENFPDGRKTKHSQPRRAQREERPTLDRYKKDTAAGRPPEGAPAAARDENDITAPSRESGGEASRKPDFPIVGIGASAGGLQALESFFAALPPHSGLAFVVIMHTDPQHTSLLPEILMRKSNTQITLIEDGMPVAANTIYVPPSAQDAALRQGVFYLKTRPGKQRLHMPIDDFFKNLADEVGEMAGGVILSGTGSDGTQGLRVIKEKSGMVMTQSPESALHAGMPASALETGLVDYVLPPDEMGGRLIEYFRHAAFLESGPEQKGIKRSDSLRRVLALLAQRTRQDFSQYKESTLVRRIERRMTVTRSRSVEDYLKFLHRDPAESRALFHDLLIGVTSFFRDPEAFSFLKNSVLPDLIARRRRSTPFRVWVPGCATGEEAFSVVIVMREVIEKVNADRQLLIFGTDIDARAIEKARQGVYPKNIAADVSPERLKRFFTEERDCFRVSREIREAVVFAEQNILRDPPFSGLDLLVCRNLLIYLKSEAQNKLFPLFHYTLNDDGILFLGTSESVSRYPEMFEVVNKPFSIYRKKRSPVRPQVAFPTSARRARPHDAEHRAANQARLAEHRHLAEAVEKLLLVEHTPACVIVNQHGEIIHIHGRTGKYLEPAPGKPNIQIADMAREGLRFPLLSALRKAGDQNREVREHRLHVKTNGDTQRIDLTVKYLDKPPLKGCLMVIFEDLRPAVPEDEGRIRPEPHHNQAKNEELEQELLRMRQDYRSAVEELETANEELRSVNEEMHSSNEELQSTNEELESSREELQSVNEELNTVNSELHSKIEELKEAHDAITDVLNSTRIAILFLDNDLHVKRFTEETARLINLIDSDNGRPLEHISHNLDYDDLPGTVRRVLKDVSSVEEEVRTRDGHWYRMRVMVYRTTGHAIEGVVLTFLNIDDQKKTEERVKELSAREAHAAKRFADSIIDTVRESLLVLDAKMTILAANRSFYETFGSSPDRALGENIFQLGDRQWDVDPLREVLEKIARSGESFEDYLIEYRLAGTGHMKLLLNGRLLREENDSENKILLAIEDVSEPKTGAIT